MYIIVVNRNCYNSYVSLWLHIFIKVARAVNGTVLPPCR